MIKLNLPYVNPPEFDQDMIVEEIEVLRLSIENGEKIKAKDKLWGRYKHLLWQSQGEKCCFCERKISSLGEGDVEHYRPKAIAKDINNKQILLEHGYWWLAYEWKNYIFCCRTCNIQKTNRFPLINEDDRVVGPGISKYGDDGSFGNESPSLVNPRFENAEDYFIYDTSKIGRVFIASVSNDKYKKRKAEDTIEIVDLNRISRVNNNKVKDTLVDDRAIVFAQLKKDIKRLLEFEYVYSRALESISLYNKLEFQEQIDALGVQVDTQKKIVASYSKYNAPFSGMCRYHLRSIDREDLIDSTPN